MLLSAFTTCLIFFTDFCGDSSHGWGAVETWMFGLGMFSAIGFIPTFLQMSSGTSAAASGLLMLPMMVGLIGTSIASGIAITRTGRYKLFPVLGTLITAAAMVAMTSLSASTPIWLICVYLFVFGAGLGLIMQVVVLVAQNAVPASQIGTATSTNNYFREVGASLGVAMFGTIFTTRLTDNLKEVFAGAGSSAAGAANATSRLDPQTLATCLERSATASSSPMRTPWRRCSGSCCRSSASHSSCRCCSSISRCRMSPAWSHAAKQSAETLEAARLQAGAGSADGQIGGDDGNRTRVISLED